MTPLRKFPSKDGLTVSATDAERIIQGAVVHLLKAEAPVANFPLTRHLLSVLEEKCGIVPDEQFGLRGSNRNVEQCSPIWPIKNNQIGLRIGWAMPGGDTRAGITLMLYPDPRSETVGPNIDEPANRMLATTLAEYGRDRLGLIVGRILDAGRPLTISWSELGLERLTRIDHFFTDRITKRVKNQQLAKLVPCCVDDDFFSPNPYQGATRALRPIPTLFVPESGEEKLEAVWVEQYDKFIDGLALAVLAGV